MCAMGQITPPQAQDVPFTPSFHTVCTGITSLELYHYEFQPVLGLIDQLLVCASADFDRLPGFKVEMLFSISVPHKKLTCSRGRGGGLESTRLQAGRPPGRQDPLGHPIVRVVCLYVSHHLPGAAHWTGLRLGINDAVGPCASIRCGAEGTWIG